MDEELSYRTLRKIQQAEKQSPQITQINKEFYRDVTTFLKQLQHRLKNEKKQQKQMLLVEESQNIEKIIRNIYEQREKKIMLAAIAKARGGNPNIKSLVPEEKKLFDKLHQNLVSIRKDLLFSINEENSYDTLSEPDVKEDLKQPPSQPGKNREQSEVEKTPILANTNPILRIKKDIPSFIGTDNNTYTLNKGDIISLPSDMAKMLTDKKVAVTIQHS
ncbi:MAG: hypothetical protein QCI00_05645 [Candidatus Thermoplasmatota archaeon]|nr:hypothetical protein [Candidatus Thermoplasmatota archaeon]